MTNDALADERLDKVAAELIGRGCTCVSLLTAPRHLTIRTPILY